MSYHTRMRRLAASSFAVALLGLAPGLVHAASPEAEVDASAESTLALDQAQPAEAVAADPSAEVAQADEDAANVAFGASKIATAKIGLDEGGQLLAFGANRTSAAIG